MAKLLRLALTTREKKKRHDYAFTAWDVSVRLLVAAEPPRDQALLASPSLGHWVQAARIPPVESASRELLELSRFLHETIQRKAPRIQRRVSARAILNLLPEYRNKATMAHAGPRPDSFYERAFPLLHAALAIAWKEGFFLPQGAQLVYVSEVELDTNGGHLARVFSLEGPQSLPDGEGIHVPVGVLPQRVYLRRGDEYKSLFPWVVFRVYEVQEQLLLFNSSNRGLVYFDCETGELLNRERLRESGIDVPDPILEHSGVQRKYPPGAIPPVEPIPSEEREEVGEIQGDGGVYRSSAGLSYLEPPSLLRRVPSRRVFFLVFLGGLLLVVGGFLFQRRDLAFSDVLFFDCEGGEGWLERCKGHAKRGDKRAALAACERAVQASRKSSVTRARTTAFLAELRCKDTFAERLPRGSLGLDVLVASERDPLLLRWDPKQSDSNTLRLTSPTCVELGSPSTTGERQVWFLVKLPKNIRENRENWYVSAGDIAREDARAMMTQCERAHHNGSDDLVRSDCGAALRTEDPAQLGLAALVLGKMHAAQGRREEAIEWYLTARLSLPADAPARPEIARSLESLCELSSRLKRAPGDPRTFKVVSWHWQDRMLAFKNEPSMNSPTMTKLFLPRGTCVLAGEIKETTEAGRINRWVDVEVDLPGAPFSRGWSHIDWLEPR